MDLVTLSTQLRKNPLNWLLSATLVYVLSTLYSTSTSTPPSLTHPDTIVFRDYTPRELAAFDGRQDGGRGRLMLAVNGQVYDASLGRNFYGPDGPYGNFAGRDASRGLAKNSFDLDMLSDVNGPIDKLEDLTGDEWESLRGWEMHFKNKYLLVGKLVENN
ncbi:hypothetical protein BZG36_03574 [Bifiguratus adelaidae]|uniref:Cytochrome b5 heme-binding domain-containing protein n=1 Tax=Bifiguratus adelaidae TaxID=1938954 RepID=A0A261Y0L0_9FUNG|nr:hypothetical protein BZG36_03574 [Bifiguratus adelaidae]